MRISDWSSDVCSSDLAVVFGTAAVSGQRGRGAAARRSRADCIGTAGGLMSDQQHTACGTMVAKPVTIGVVGVIVLASALVLNHFILPGEEGESVPTVVTPAPQSASAPSANVPPAGKPSARGPD